MVLSLVFLRHGKTAGNLQKRYIGVTDESLCSEGREELLYKPPLSTPSSLYASPMKRCIETAAILFPHLSPRLIPDFRECNFGDFEGKNYDELNGSAAYQRFIDTMGAEIPGGEPVSLFRERCCQGFLTVVNRMCQENCPDAAIICHGGTIMAVMERFEKQKRGFYGYQVSNGCGYLANYDTKGETLSILREI